MMPQTKWQIENADKWKAYKAEWRANNRAKMAASNKEWVENNKDRKATTSKAWHDADYERNKSARIAKIKEWQQANPEKRRAIINNSNAIRQRLIGGQVISKWYSKKILAIYENCPPGHHVDHIVALRGRGVCGLHVPWNLQYLPALDNMRKSNK